MIPMQEFRSLHRIVDMIFDSGKYMSNKELAKKSGLSITTVAKLRRSETMYPRSQTIMLLAKAVGFEVKLIKR